MTGPWLIKLKYHDRICCYFLKPDEIEALSKVAIDERRGAMSPAVVGQPAVKIAQMAGIKVPDDTKILVAELGGLAPNIPCPGRNLADLGLLYCGGLPRIRKCEEMTEFGGLGHSAVIHSEDQAAIQAFAAKVRTGFWSTPFFPRSHW